MKHGTFHYKTVKVEYGLKEFWEANISAKLSRVYMACVKGLLRKGLTILALSFELFKLWVYVPITWKCSVCVFLVYKCTKFLFGKANNEQTSLQPRLSI